ncbi:hypothetical protein B0H13DRAFT_2664520 [Mycena leptocephala]|nr:hypothetical protein B0H13DRAFT_2664520 [Mycena leptocephala]
MFPATILSVVLLAAADTAQVVAPLVVTPLRKFTSWTLSLQCFLRPLLTISHVLQPQHPLVINSNPNGIFAYSYSNNSLLELASTGPRATGEFDAVDLRTVVIARERRALIVSLPFTVQFTGLNIPRGDTTYTECRAAHLGEGALLRTRKGGFDGPPGARGLRTPFFLVVTMHHFHFARSLTFICILSRHEHTSLLAKVREKQCDVGLLFRSLSAKVREKKS